MKVLFSPIGSTDPISNYKDGAMLHICRVYRPDKVYFYLSKEMCKYHDLDDRYREAVHMLEKETGWKCQIEVIRDEEMENVQLFDAFINCFEQMIDDIRKKDSPDELLVNISSGTPAMKASLQMISILGSDIKAVQVSTPLKSSNKYHEDKDTYDLKTQWEFNEDRQDGYENRCVVSNAKNLLDRIRKENIIKYISVYDYEAAKMQAEELFVQPSEEFMRFLRIAAARKNLDLKYINANRKAAGCDKWFPIVSEREMKEYEYLLSMQIKLQKKQYVDFMRDITPIFYSLSQRILKKYCKLSLADIGEEKNNGWCLSMQKLQQRGIKKGYNWHDNTNIAASNLLIIIEQLCNKKDVVELMNNIRKAEQKVRNLAAHEIIGISAEEIKKRTGGFTPEKIMDMLFKLAVYSGINIKETDKNAYDIMNSDLIKFLI